MGRAAIAIGMMATSELALAYRCGTCAHSTCSGTSTKPPPTPSSPPSIPPRKPIARKTAWRRVRSIIPWFWVASRAGLSPRSGAGTGRLTAPPPWSASPSSFSLARAPACRVLYPWRPVSTTRASSRKNDSTSVTRPIDCQPARDVDAKRGAEQRRLDIMDRQRVAGEKDLDQTKLDQAREINPGASVHDRRTGDDQDPAARVANLPHLVGDAGDEDLLWFLGW